MAVCFSVSDFFDLADRTDFVRCKLREVSENGDAVRYCVSYFVVSGGYQCAGRLSADAFISSVFRCANRLFNDSGERNCDADFTSRRRFADLGGLDAGNGKKCAVNGEQ